MSTFANHFHLLFDSLKEQPFLTMSETEAFSTIQIYTGAIFEAMDRLRFPRALVSDCLSDLRSIQRHSVLSIYFSSVFSFHSQCRSV